MVVLHVKRDSKSAFLFETRLDNTVAQTTDDVVAIYNGRLKVCKKIEQSALLLPAAYRPAAGLQVAFGHRQMFKSLLSLPRQIWRGR